MAVSPSKLWLAALLAAIVLHNLEEAIALAAMPQAPAIAAQALGLDMAVPPLSRIYAGLALFTLFPMAVLWRAMRHPTKRLTFLACMIAAMAAANALVPHIAATAILGQYMPGSITAAFVSLPVAAGFLITALRKGWAALHVWLAAIAVGLAILPLVLLGFWALARLVAELAR